MWLSLPLIFIATTLVWVARWAFSGCKCCFRIEKSEKYQNQIFPEKKNKKEV